MSRLDSANNALCFGNIFKCINCLVVRHGNIFRSADIVKICVLRAYTRIVKPCADRINRSNLTVFVLAKIRLHSVENTERAG